MFHRADGHSWWLKFDADLNLLGDRYSNSVPLRENSSADAVPKISVPKNLLPPAFSGVPVGKPANDGREKTKTYSAPG
jgi:hypothetical protein